MAPEAPEQDGTSRSALEAQYFVDDGGGVIGPVLGTKLKELIENGVVARRSNVNRVGAPNWTPVLQTAPFGGFFPAELRPAPPERRFASAWIRLAAYVIDELFCLAALFVVAHILVSLSAALFGFEATKAYLVDHEVVGDVIGLVVVLAYQGFFMAGAWQATPGKRLCGLYVIRTDGARIDVAIAVLRYLCYFLSFLPFGAGFAMIFWTNERKALHDVLCGTRVVHGRL